MLPSPSTKRNVSVGSLVLAVQILSSFFQSGSELFTGSKKKKKKSGSFPKSFTAPCGQLGELVSTDNVVEKIVMAMGQLVIAGCYFLVTVVSHRYWSDECNFMLQLSQSSGFLHQKFPHLHSQGFAEAGTGRRSSQRWPLLILLLESIQLSTWVDVILLQGRRTFW